MRKLRPREFKGLAQSHMGGMGMTVLFLIYASLVGTL